MGESVVVLIRSSIAFLSLLVFSRLLGKTQMAQLTFFEYVTGITIGSIAGDLTTNLGVRPWPIYVGLIAWAGLTMLTQVAALKNRWVSKLLDGEPVVVIQNGQVLENNLRAIRLRGDDLVSMLRAQGYFDIKEVEVALMESRGGLSVLPRSQYQPVTASDLSLSTKYEGMGIELVVDGEIQKQNLRRLGLNVAWLKQQISQQNMQMDEVFLAVLDTQGKLYLDKYEDRIPPMDDLSDYPGPN